MKVKRESGTSRRIDAAVHAPPGRVALAESSALWGESISQSKEAAVKAELDAASANKTGRARREARLAAARAIKAREDEAAGAASGRVVEAFASGGGGGTASILDALQEVEETAAVTTMATAAKGSVGGGKKISAGYAAALHFSSLSDKSKGGGGPLAALRANLQSQGLMPT
jgi:hypothetical protein